MTGYKQAAVRPLSKSETVKVTKCTAGLKADLDRYAALHAQTYGEPVDALMPIPHTCWKRSSHAIGGSGKRGSRFHLEKMAAM